MNMRAMLKTLPMIALALLLGAAALTNGMIEAASPATNAVVVPEDMAMELALLGAGELVSTGWSRSPECFTTVDCGEAGLGAKCASPRWYPPFGCKCTWSGGDFGCHPVTIGW